MPSCYQKRSSMIFSTTSDRQYREWPQCRFHFDTSSLNRVMLCPSWRSLTAAQNTINGSVSLLVGKPILGLRPTKAWGPFGRGAPLGIEYRFLDLSKRLAEYLRHFEHVDMPHLSWTPRRLFRDSRNAKLVCTLVFLVGEQIQGRQTSASQEFCPVPRARMERELLSMYMWKTARSIFWWVEGCRWNTIVRDKLLQADIWDDKTLTCLHKQ